MVGSEDWRASRRMWAFWVSLGVSALLVLALAASAHAAGEYEPNDSRDSAYGPLAGGTPYTGTIETDNDVDWFAFYVKTYSQMDFSATMVKSCSSFGEASIELYDKDGRYIRYFYTGSPNETSHLLVTLNPGRYYLEVEDPACTGDRYRFQIDPAASITTSRECGEAIVARDAIGPLLADASAKLTTNTVKLSEKVQAVRKANRVFKRVKRRRGASRYEKRNALRRLERAKAARAKVLQEGANLQTLVTQQQQALAGAEGQIATYC